MILLSDFYKNLFGCKVYKVSLCASCSCPNRDGTKGSGGCIFCSQEGSGDFIAKSKSISEQFINGKSLVEKKAKGRSGSNRVLYLPYFQSFSSTYGDFEILKSEFLEALSMDGVAGLAIATRPDCLGERFIDFFSEISEKYFLQIELGLQTSNEKTGNVINRCYTDMDYENAIALLQNRLPSAHIVTHLIFGLPNENIEDMIDSVRFVCKVNNRKSDKKFFGIKITNLYVLKDTALEKLFLEKHFECLTQDEYFYALQKALKLLPENAVLHRFTGDPPKKIALAPEWALNKRKVLNEAKKLFIKQ
ncbi:TIGR01212 family radical SAM protein [Treponema pectinovorum]|uniref:TIGR01212 family radical SAM protein n=1 Tax=Treponema pectinovorum TaxID=164 RepID=UPI0011C71630|nr:TIGR01212 family radical SAM protein [Treponema pectinovorum]